MVFLALVLALAAVIVLVLAAPGGQLPANLGVGLALVAIAVVLAVLVGPVGRRARLARRIAGIDALVWPVLSRASTDRDNISTVGDLDPAAADIPCLDDLLAGLRAIARSEVVLLTLRPAETGDLAAADGDTRVVEVHLAPPAVPEPAAVDRLARIADAATDRTAGADGSAPAPVVLWTRDHATAADTDVRTALQRGPVAVIAAAALMDGAARIGTLQFAGAHLDGSDLAVLQHAAERVAQVITTHRRAVRLLDAALYDDLTGLMTRSHFPAAVRDWQAAHGVTPSATAIAIFSVETFDELSDSLGFDAADDVLSALGQRLRTAMPPDTPVARVSRDAVGVVTPADGDRLAGEHAARLHTEVGRPREVLPGLTIDVPLVVGVARGGRVGGTEAGGVEEILRSAEVALHHARRVGTSPTVYSPGLDSRRANRLRLVRALRAALDSSQVGLAFQPMISLRTNEVVGAEALARWNDPRDGPISPDRFISAAERSGLIGGLTRYVLVRSLAACRSWLDQGRHIGISVNMSARSLLDETFVDDVAELLAVAEVPPELLTFELTERNVIAEPERAMPNLHRLRQLGTRLSVDDFGTGYSSLGYLRRLPIDEVKIDKTLVFGMSSDLGGPAMVRAIIELGHSLGLEMVAEGVEDDLTRDLLTGMGCDVMQGYVVSRALPLDQFQRWLRQDGGLSVPRQSAGRSRLAH
ncbi:MAG: putative bifunctional diguanylate cyclase/phosphodiesterase [Mycobacteriales bacterium]